MKTACIANHKPTPLTALLTATVMAFVFPARSVAQTPRRIAFCLGVETAAKVQLLPKTGSPYGLLGSSAIHGTLRFLPIEDGGIISALRIACVVDNIRYNYAPGRSFTVNRLCARAEAEGLVPTRWPALWLSAGIGVDWHVAQNEGFGARGNGGEDSLVILYAAADLDRADKDLWAARRLVTPIVTLGPVLRIPTRRKPLWVQIFVRQALLISYEMPVAVTIREDFFKRYDIVVSQRPTYFGLSASYFF